MSPGRYAAVLFAFGAQRGIELLYSARNERVIRRRQPSAPQAARSIFKWIAVANLGLFTQPISFIGLPVVAVPVWTKGEHLPLGVQVIAAPNREAHALRVAFALEQLGIASAPVTRPPAPLT